MSGFSINFGYLNDLYSRTKIPTLISNPPPLPVRHSSAYHHQALFILIGHLFSGYNPGGYKSPEELANLDAEDESLARWKASLGIVPGASSSESGPKVMKSFMCTLHYSLIRLLVDPVDA